LYKTTDYLTGHYEPWFEKHSTKRIAVSERAQIKILDFGFHPDITTVGKSRDGR
jgi:hypothetical protein